jgi:hypothetical protein
LICKVFPADLRQRWKQLQSSLAESIAIIFLLNESFLVCYLVTILLHAGLFLTYLSTLKLEAKTSSEMSVGFQRTTQNLHKLLLFLLLSTSKEVHTQMLKLLMLKEVVHFIHLPQNCGFSLCNRDPQIPRLLQ